MNHTNTTYGTVTLTCVPVRATPNEKAEQTTQLLFGDEVQITDKENNWLLISNPADNESGWVDIKMITPLNNKINTPCTFAYLAKPISTLKGNNNLSSHISFASFLPNYKDGKICIAEQTAFINPNDVITQPLTLSSDNLNNITSTLLNIPYLWGGKTCFGMDCSALTQLIMTLFGFHIPRNAKDQATQGERIHSFNDITTGDLLFFSKNNTQPISHVGIALNNARVLHCSGQVRIDILDENGIWKNNNNTPVLTHHLHHIQRLKPYTSPYPKK